MRRIVVFGNSGSGKSTLAKSMCGSEGCSHFDLDSIAWLETNPPERAPLPDSSRFINEFVLNHPQWVIEGCYADLIEIAAVNATEMIFLNLPVEECIANARSRPWEPHKYSSKESQDASLDMLIQWIKSYPDRSDACSLLAHTQLIERFEGTKTVATSNNARGLRS